MELRIWFHRAAGMAKIFFIFAAAGFLAGYAAMAYFVAPPQKIFDAFYRFCEYRDSRHYRNSGFLVRCGISANAFYRAEKFG
jgi:hypothetical protein